MRHKILGRKSLKIWDNLSDMMANKKKSREEKKIIMATATFLDAKHILQLSHIVWDALSD